MQIKTNLITAFSQNNQTCSAPVTFGVTIIIVTICCFLGMFWALYNYRLVKKIDVRLENSEDRGIMEVSSPQKDLLIQLGFKISEGSKQFLRQEYLICLIFVGIMFFVILGFSEEGIYTAIAFFIGAIVSMACGAIGMLIATQANFRTTFCAKSSLASAFRTAYRAGCAMGFALVSIGLLVLIILITIFKSAMVLEDQSGNGTNNFYYKALFEAIAGYGLGGSFVALFGRVGGGIYTKAADVGADLVGKVQSGLPEDSPRNPATIADNVGDNVGDVAGMSADLFGSFAQSTCASLVISSGSLIGAGKDCQYQIANIMYPLTLIAVGIFLCIFVSSLSTHILSVQTKDKVQATLKRQLIISTILLLGAILLVCYLSFPSSFYMKIPTIRNSVKMTIWTPYMCSILGLVSGMLIAAFTQYVTSHAYSPVRELAETCKAGPASNVTLGLALGYMSTLAPVIFIALTAFFSTKLMGFYGVSLAALGMLSNLPLSLAIDGYGPISDNAGGIAQMAQMGSEVRQITDSLDAAGNTTAAIGKGFAIGSAALVSLSLFGGFLHNSGLQDKISLISLIQPDIYAGLLLGAMIPYIFSAFTIKSVGKAAFGMVNEVRRQIRHNPGILQGTVEPDYKACIRISTRASLREMIAPGALVIISPLALGFIFGPTILAGFLPGSLVSGVQLAISAANTGGAWDNAKKYIQSGALRDQHGLVIKKGSQVHKAAVVGDTVGDPLKDTSGPSLNILIKLMAILSLIFASKFTQLHPL